jgi:hypothetical protein
VEQLTRPIYVWVQYWAKPRDDGSGSSPNSYISWFNAWLNLKVLGYYPIFSYFFGRNDPGKKKENVDPSVWVIVAQHGEYLTKKPEIIKLFFVYMYTHTHTHIFIIIIIVVIVIIIIINFYALVLRG